MKHEEFEKQMFSHVNKNCQMKELDRQEIERAAMEEYRIRCKCKKANAIIGIIVWIACFLTITVAVGALNWLDLVSVEFAIAVTALAGFATGLNVNSMWNRIKK